MQRNISTDLCLSRIGLGLIFCYCLLASIFYSPFAQIHLTLHFLPFPIFVGEILLFICLVLFLSVSKDPKLFNRRSIVLLSLYFGWVLFKALINYYYDGPLTCRNAALFYYPIFAVFAYCFYQKSKIPRKVLISLALLAAGILFFKVMGDYYWWMYVTLFAIAVWNTKSVKWRRLGWVFLAVIFLLGKEYLYQGSRSHFVSVFGAVVFLVFYFGTLLAKRHNYAVLSILLISVLFFIMGFFVFSHRNDISSVTSLKGMIDAYNDFDRKYQAQQGGFVPKKLSVHLYNPKKFKDLYPHSPGVAPQPVVTATVTSQPVITASSVTSQPVITATVTSQPVITASSVTFQPVVTVSVTSQPKVTATAASQPVITARVTSQPVITASSVTSQPVVTVSVTSQSKVTARVTSQPVVTVSLTPLTDWLKNIQYCQNREGRPFDLDEGNIVFRLFVWRDMVHEFIQEPTAWWWGFSFGHPQRSRSLEVLGWAQSEWARDGWITPHNSFFHIIYRAGILGVFLIGILFFMMYRLVVDFFKMNSIEGGLLVGALVYWLVLSNFLVILEFPYNAIIFWTLFGITWAYRDGLK